MSKQYDVHFRFTVSVYADDDTEAVDEAIRAMQYNQLTRMEEFADPECLEEDEEDDD